MTIARDALAAQRGEGEAAGSSASSGSDSGGAPKFAAMLSNARVSVSGGSVAFEMVMLTTSDPTRPLKRTVGLAALSSDGLNEADENVTLPTSRVALFNSRRIPRT